MSRDDVAEDQRRRILLAAADLIAKRGYQDTTIELIVRRAKVGYATFNKNFEDREACLLAIVDAAAEEVRERIGEVVGQESQPWPDAVATALRTFFDVIVSNPAVARVCLVETLTAGPTAVARYEQALQDFGRFLKPGRELDSSRGDLPDTLEDTLAGGVFWMAYQRLIVGEADKLRTLLPEAIELVLSPYVGEEEAVRVAHDHAVSAADPA